MRTRLLGGEEAPRLKQVMEEAEGGANGEGNMEAYTLPCVRWIASGDLLYDPGLCSNLEGWKGVGGGREAEDRGDTCKPMTASC